MATINRRLQKDGTESFRVGYRQDGRLKWSPTLTSGEGAADLKRLIERIGPDAALKVLLQRSGRDTRTGPPLLSEWTERHLELLGASATAGTVAEYRRMAARTWLPRLGELPLDAISRDAVIEWVAWQRRQETSRSVKARAKATREGRQEPAPALYTPKSIRNAHGLLSSILAAAVEAEHITRNPAHGAPLPRDAAEHEREIFTEDEWQAFISHVQPHYVPLTLLLLATGVRIGEATAIQARDLDLDATVWQDGAAVPMPAVHIRRAWKKGETTSTPQLGSTKSRRGVRTIVLPAQMVAVLRPLLVGLGPGDFVFTAVEGGRIAPHRFRERQWGKALRRAGITKTLTPHSLRHTSASWLLMAGVAPQVVQHRLGHESLSTTSRVYAHLLTDAQMAAAQATQRGMTGRPAAAQPEDGALPEIEG